MNRRQILSIGLCSAVLPLSGCLTRHLHQERIYTEKVGGVFISSDKKTLAFISKNYHYIFEAPPTILAALDPLLHTSIVSAIFQSFVVDGDNKITGIIKLTARGDLNEAQKNLANKAGFLESTGSEMSAEIAIQGTRYLAKPMGKLAEEKLNREYYVHIKELPSLGERGLRMVATPISVAADGALVIGFIVLLPFFLPGLFVAYKRYLG